MGYTAGFRDAPGDNNGAIHVIQRALAAAGFNPGPIDGIYGSQTIAAIHAFQQARGLPIGSADDQTLVALGVGASSPAGGGAATGTASREQILAKYPHMAWAMDNPELAALLTRAASQGYTPIQLQAELYKTSFWQTTSAATRSWLELQGSDPATARLQIDQRTMEIEALGAQMGFPPGDPMFRQIAEQSLRLGWTQQQIQTQLATNLGQFGPDHPGHPGTAFASADSVRAMAANYFIRVSDQEAWEWSKRLLSGSMTLEGLEAMYRDQAASLFPHLKSQLDQGMTVQQIYGPMRSQIAQILELNPEVVDPMADARWLAPFQGVGGGGGGSAQGGSGSGQSAAQQRMMTMYELQQWARQQPEYQFTQQARSAAAQLGETILQTFGKKAS